MPDVAQSPIWLPGAVAALFAAVHILSPRLSFLDDTPRSKWLSFGGGVSVAYVLVHLMPELARLRHEAEQPIAGREALFVFALAGLVSFYVLERIVRRRGHDRTRISPAAAFWLHIASFAVYNFLIGYLLEEQAREEGIQGLILYAVAIGMHFTVNDRSLYRHHGPRYLAKGRWWLALAVLMGWTAAVAFELPEVLVTGAFALVAGSVIFTVMKEELPEERESRIWAFVAGAAGYAALLLML